MTTGDLFAQLKICKKDLENSHNSGYLSKVSRNCEKAFQRNGDHHEIVTKNLAFSKHFVRS